MTAYVEVWTASGPELLPLSGDRLTVGKADGNDVVLSDAASSRMHAVLQSYRAGWSVRDLGSRNGTFVNGQRILAERTLHPGDEIRIGETRLVFRAASDGKPTATTTRAGETAPDLTRREREVLVALCRPVLSGSFLTEPASVRQIAEELVITESAVKKHLPPLYDKFQLYDADRRRGRLAAEAIRRGAVSLVDVRSNG